jgi:uncharacterized RDD family membrane protein YckC
VTTAYQTRTDPTAVLGRRTGAYVVDWLVLAALPIAIFFATADPSRWEAPVTCDQIEASPTYDMGGRTCIDDWDITIGDDEYSAVTFRTIAPILAGGIALVYLVVVQWIIQGLTGATLGKALFGIRTVDPQGRGPGIGKQFLRGLLWIVPDGIISCFGIPVVAALTAGLSRGHRRVGDMVAGTYVVRAADRGRPVILPERTTGPAPAPGVGPSQPGEAPYQPPPAGGAVTDQTAGYASPPPDTAAAPTESEAPPDDQPPAAPGPPQSGPQWDPERNAYIQWDPNRGSWLIFDDGSQEWKPLT